MIVIRALGQGRQEGLIDPRWHPLCGSISKRLSTALAEPLDVVTPTDTRNGIGCLAVDQYQRIIDGTETVRGDFGNRLQTRLGQNPYSHEPGSKPAPPEHCAGNFGNSDAYVSVVTP